MKKIKDSSFEKIIKYKKYEDLYDLSSIECRIALLVTFIIDIIFVLSIKKIGENNVIEDGVSYLDTVGMALIGFLGFIVTGLAILTGAISSTVVKRLQERNKIQALEKILLSFYLLGLVSATIISMAFVFHFISKLPFGSMWQITIVLISIIGYLVVFSVFYAVKLIGNCIELFYIISSMQIVIENTKGDIKQKYNNYRIMALEKIVLISGLSSIENYANEIKEMIESDNLSEQEKAVCLNMHKQLFSNTPD